MHIEVTRILPIYPALPGWRVVLADVTPAEIGKHVPWSIHSVTLWGVVQWGYNDHGCCTWSEAVTGLMPLNWNALGPPEHCPSPEDCFRVLAVLAPGEEPDDEKIALRAEELAKMWRLFEGEAGSPDQLVGAWHWPTMPVRGEAAPRPVDSSEAPVSPLPRHERGGAQRR
jgi:hypothetical protein